MQGGIIEAGEKMLEEFVQEYKKIGLNIAYYRKLNGMTQEEFAEKLGVHTSFLGQIEAPNIKKAISMDTLFRIAKALDIPPAKLLDFD